LKFCKYVLINELYKNKKFNGKKSLGINILLLPNYKKHFGAQKKYEGNSYHFWSTVPCTYPCVNKKPNHVHFTVRTNHTFEPTKDLLSKYIEFLNLFPPSFIFFFFFSNTLDISNVFGLKG
jgi:hypothetical protein